MRAWCWGTLCTLLNAVVLGLKMEETHPKVWDAVVEEMEEKLMDFDFEASDIEFDWRLGANARKFERELYEKYGMFKDIILDERFQRLKSMLQENIVLDFDVVLGDPLMPLVTCIVVLFMARGRVSNDVLGLLGAFLFNLNPLYVVVAYILYQFSPTHLSVSKPKQFVPRPSAAAATPASSSSDNENSSAFDHVLVGADLSTLYTAALLSRVGHRCCVLKPVGATPLEVVAPTVGSKSDEDELPPVPLLNATVGKVERYQLLFDMLASCPEDMTNRVTFMPVGAADGSFVYSVLKMRKRIANARTDLWTLRPGDLSLASDAASKLLVDKARLEAFLAAVQRAQEHLVLFLNSRVGPSACTLEVARAELSRQVLNLSSESVGDIYSNFKLEVPPEAVAGDGSGNGQDGGGDGTEVAATPQSETAAAAAAEDEDDEDAQSITLLLERLAVVGSDELTLADGECSGLGLAQVLTCCSQGAFYPGGGAAALGRYLEGLVIRAGGKVVADAAIQEIDFGLPRQQGDDPTEQKKEQEPSRACGVRLVDGTVVAASRSVISGVGMLSTYTTLVPPSCLASLGEHPLKPFEGLVEAAPRVRVVFWLRGSSAEECGLGCSDYWNFGGCKGGAASHVWSPSARDPTWDDRHPTVQAVIVELPDPQVVLTSLPGLSSGPLCYSSSPSLSYSPRTLIDSARRVLTEAYPLAASRILREMLVPHDIDAQRGHFSFTKKKFAAPLSAESPLPGLFFCGRDMATSGLSGDVQGGYVAACAVLGYTKAELAAGRNIATDIQNLPQRFK